MINKLSILLAIIFLLLIPSIAKADGLFIPHEREDIIQPSQKAIILFSNNTEQLIIQSKYEGNITDFGWIIPLPAYPKVENASEKFFIALHEITYPEDSDENKIFNSLRGAAEIEVLEKVSVGPYDISILSTEDSNSLLEWLHNNNYNIPKIENAKEIFDYYINKKWYFLAIKVDIIRNRNEIIEKYRIIDKRILSLDNIVYYLSEDSLEDIQDKKVYENSTFKKLKFDSAIYNNYLNKYWEEHNIHQNIHNFVVNEISGYQNSEEVVDFYKNLGYNSSNISQLESLLENAIYEDLNKNRSYEYSKFKIICQKYKEIDKIQKYSELNNKYLAFLYRNNTVKNQLTIDISNFVNPEILAMEKKLNSGTIEPVKMTFAAKEIIYPLKISSLGNRDMEILIYTLTDNKTQAKNFSLEYADWIYSNITNTTSLTSSYWSLGMLINKEYFLTKLRANLTVEQMDQDLIITNTDDNQPYRMKIETLPSKKWQVILSEIFGKINKSIQQIKDVVLL